MKKIDLHIHTVKTNSDADFEFNMESLAEYVKTKSIDVLVIFSANYFRLLFILYLSVIYVIYIFI